MRKFLAAALSVLAWCGLAQAQIAPSNQAAQTSDDTERLAIAEIAAMPAGSWLHYGRPWRDVDPGRADNCGVNFSSLLGAWNGVLWDGKYVWVWAAGGHGDGCFNGIVRYDLQAGRPEMVVPHLPLNVPFCRGPFTKANGEEDCYYEPYVSERPYPGGMGVRVHEWDGGFLRPRASHMYNNMVKIGDWIYLLTGQIYGSGKGDSQVWRFNAAADDPASTIARLPDRFDPNAGPDRDGDGQSDGEQAGSYAVNWIKRPGKPLLLFSGSTVCEPDLVSGQYRCSTQNGINFSTAATMAWDAQRQGIWAIDSKLNRLVFMRETDGQWQFDNSLSITDLTAIDRDAVGLGGICLVPTDKGVNPVVLGQSKSLLRWDGRQLHEIELPGGPGPGRRRIFNKWTWNDDLGVCLGTWAVDEGFWIYKPDFVAERERAAVSPEPPGVGATGPSVPPPKATEQAQTPRESSSLRQSRSAGLPPAPQPNILLKDNPLLDGRPHNVQQAQPEAVPVVSEIESATMNREWWIDRTSYPSFAGHRVAPSAWQPAAWNGPIERLPEAPDYNALCPGPWAELHYRSESDVANSAAQMRSIVRGGTPNVRVYLHPLVDKSERVVPYASHLKFDEVKCSEVVGVPSGHERPQTTGGIGPGQVGIIARGIVLQGEGIGWSGNRAANRVIQFIVLHDLDIYGVGHLWGISSPNAPLTYLELRGNVIGHNTDWHVIYLERSIGKLVALGNVFYGSGRRGHAFKNLAHQSRIEGNVFSNVGIDGQPLEVDNRGRPIVGLMPLDLYLCTETIFRNNTIVFRTSDSVRTFMAYRGRRAWGNCDKGRRLPDGRWELWPPESEDYNDPAKWREIAAATAAFDRGYEAAKAEPWLFAHKVENNQFIVFNAAERDGQPIDDTRAAQIVSLRPVADNRIREKLNEEARALVQECASDSDRTSCILRGMSSGLRYAYDHIPPAWQSTMVANGDIPRGVPIPAPEGWVERAGVFWGDNQFITCSGDGQTCAKTEPRPIRGAEREWDDLQYAHPPRIIMQ